MRIHSYPKIYHLGHPAIADLLKDPVYVEEKADGSQFSWSKDEEGNLHFRSKGAEIFTDSVQKLFEPAVRYIESIREDLIPGAIYRGEALHKPKHNTLEYARAPRHNVVLFDVERAPNDFMSKEDREQEAARLDLEAVPSELMTITSLDDVKHLMDRESFLGGTKVEGVVIKNHTRFGKDGKALMAKWVSEAFKESHKTAWKAQNPGNNDIKLLLGQKYRTEARWQKAVQHLRDDGKLTETPKDIGMLMKELHLDLEAECSDEIKLELYKWAIGDIKRGICRGFPEWYKEQLAKKQFG